LALYHLSVKPVSRGGGRSAVACAAYRFAELLHDERTGQTHDYKRKQGVDARMLVMTDGTGGLVTMGGEDWTEEREKLWNAAEAAEKRKDARVAREYEVALPHELDASGRRRLVAAFAGELVERYGVAVDAAIHAPGREGDHRNWHAHVLTTTRRATPEGLGEKAAIELSDTARAKQGLGSGAAEIEGLRAVWAGEVNRALERIQAEARVDHRSYARQGRLELTATQHAGPAVSGLERKAEQKRAQAQAREGQDRAGEAPERVREASAVAEGPGMAPAVPERPQEGQERPREGARAVAVPVASSGPVQGHQASQAGQDGPRRATDGATGRDAARPPSPTGSGQEGPVRGAAGMHGSGSEPVTRVGQRNAEIQARNRAVEAARAAVARAQRVLGELERAAAAGVRRVLGLARGLGAQVAEVRAEREREAAQQREAQERAEAERRAEVERQEQHRQAVERARQREQQGWSAEAYWKRLTEEGRKLTQADRDAARARTAALTPEEQERQGQRRVEAPRQSRGMGMGR